MYRILFPTLFLLFVSFAEAREFSIVFKSLLTEKITLKACRNVEETATTHSKRLNFLGGNNDTWSLNLMPGVQVDRAIRVGDDFTGNIIALKKADQIVCNIEITLSGTPAVRATEDDSEFHFDIYEDGRGIYILAVGYDNTSVSEYISGLKVPGMPQQWSRCW
ncbi:MAG: hypothetical protein LBB25_00455 [Holosporaceae bacterium]|jgi:hypothetical protein|nr:hypothetical protein [Holosporaceae bacterium]